MNRANFPFLTIDLLETQGQTLLNWLGQLWPEAGPVVRIVQAILPLINQLSAVKRTLQVCCDEINAITQAQPAAVSG